MKRALFIMVLLSQLTSAKTVFFDTGEVIKPFFPKKTSFSRHELREVFKNANTYKDVECETYGFKGFTYGIQCSSFNNNGQNKTILNSKDAIFATFPFKELTLTPQNLVDGIYEATRYKNINCEIYNGKGLAYGISCSGELR